MPWYIWLLIAIVIGFVIGGLLNLLSAARPIPLTEEQKKRIAQRNAQLDEEEKQERKD
ncbi:uncharacterized protein DUF1049 [Azomonas agilis]|uniref:Uncharacterized protein DUF1049 n=1 Tax=Azomonas agilis TaxID=116849 RepID=A0A562I1Q0_9GAMM|nr:DUF2897 family protein [Azomonas agilis]TWH64961.1 uncharacterized protein DUF1049 [Azomonas agilis]